MLTNAKIDEHFSTKDKQGREQGGFVNVTKIKKMIAGLSKAIGSLSKHDVDGYENVI